jgi:transposase
MVLASSRLMFVRPVIRLDQTSWGESHVEAFRFFGGAPARLVPNDFEGSDPVAGPNRGR